MLSVNRLFSPLFEGLSPRQKEVLEGRFGLGKSAGGEQTLAALGEKYGVTRERVRQIEFSAIDALRKKIKEDKTYQELIDKNQKFLSKAGGVARKEALLAFNKELIDGLSMNHLDLLSEASGELMLQPATREFWPFYYTDRTRLKSASAFINQWSQHIKSRKPQILSEGHDAQLKSFLKKSDVSETQAINFLSISKKFGQNSFGDKGLTEWPEINPKTVRDKVYLILGRKKEPLHFRDIAKFINDSKLSVRTVSAPTVHNELIKDQRFVLVGRGIYGLREHGHEPGTAREVISRLIKKNGSLRPKEVILAVQKERFFKPNTILVNLQNKSFFKRLPDGTYQVRES